MAYRACRILGKKYEAISILLLQFLIAACASPEGLVQEDAAIEKIVYEPQENIESSQVFSTLHPVPSLILPREDDVGSKPQVIPINREEIMHRLKNLKPITIIDSTNVNLERSGNASREGHLGGKLFFLPQSSDLTNADRKTISDIVALYGKNKKAIRIVGRIPLGSYNTLSEISLAWQRIDAVKENLIDKKIPPHVLKVETIPTSAPDGGVEIYFQY